jgi:DNA (cytosine-5)-methyltransferase 1
VRRRRLLDLFCGQGGASHGYALAGFDVVGVDIDPQPRYPYEFHRADAMTYPLDGFDVLAGSPPCNDHSSLSSLVGAQGTGWLLQATIDRFRATGRPYVVENVAGADMPGALTLCGTEFGLHTFREGRRYMLRRHRQFASNVFLMGAGGCTCGALASAMGVYGHGGGRGGGRGVTARAVERAELLDVDWMTVQGQAQAIPPAYTRFIGEQLLGWLTR